MFCFQCQETAKNQGCTVRGVCGKSEETACLQDLLIYICKGIAVYAQKLKKMSGMDKATGKFICEALFTTITNAAWDNDAITSKIKQALKVREGIKEKLEAELRQRGEAGLAETLPDCATWSAGEDSEIATKARSEELRITYTGNEDVRSLRELLTIGCKGIAAYTDHAAVLGYEKEGIYAFLVDALASTTRDIPVDEMTELVYKAGETAVAAMALLDEANTSSYGDPVITQVNTGVGKKPGILISGHDLKDMEELLEQTEGTGVDIYTHGEMLPANYYPAFKKYGHLAGNYGGSWWKQSEEFEKFNGPVIMTTNCITPVKDSYKDRIFTTGMAGYPGVRHIPDRLEGAEKDFSEVIELAKKCDAPEEIEKGEIIGGFAHVQVLALADKVVEAVKSGKIKRFIVMAGCDGRQPGRSYFAEVAENLPKDTVILTAGCAKYRYNKLKLGDIDGIPRVLDAGQCNDSYSLAVIALKLKEVFGLDDINELPISFDLAWYEQKAVAVLLALLHLGVKGIRLGPTLPAFLSPNVAKVLVDKFGIRPIGEAKEDVMAMTRGE